LVSASALTALQTGFDRKHGQRRENDKRVAYLASPFLASHVSTNFEAAVFLATIDNETAPVAIVSPLPMLQLFSKSLQLG
jgi:hypothetical protein